MTCMLQRGLDAACGERVVVAHGCSRGRQPWVRSAIGRAGERRRVCLRRRAARMTRRRRRTVCFCPKYSFEEGTELVQLLAILLAKLLDLALNLSANRPLEMELLGRQDRVYCLVLLQLLWRLGLCRWGYAPPFSVHFLLDADKGTTLKPGEGEGSETGGQSSGYGLFYFGVASLPDSSCGAHILVLDTLPVDPWSLVCSCSLGHAAWDMSQSAVSM